MGKAFHLVGSDDRLGGRLDRHSPSPYIGVDGRHGSVSPIEGSWGEMPLSMARSTHTLRGVRLPPRIFHFFAATIWFIGAAGVFASWLLGDVARSNHACNGSAPSLSSTVECTCFSPSDLQKIAKIRGRGGDGGRLRSHPGSARCRMSGLSCPSRRRLPIGPAGPSGIGARRVYRWEGVGSPITGISRRYLARLPA